MRVHQRATRPILAARYARRSSNSRAATRPTSSHSRYVRKGIHSNSANAFIGWWDRNEAFRVMKHRLMWAKYGFPAKPGAKWPEWGPRAAGRRERPREPFGTIPASQDIYTTPSAR